MIRSDASDGRRAVRSRPMSFAQATSPPVSPAGRRWGADPAPPRRRADRLARLRRRCCRSCRSTSATTASIFGRSGVVVAAWPAARLIGEPIFGWVADRTRRVPLMVAGNVAGRDLRVPAARVRRGGRRSSSCAASRGCRPRCTTRPLAATSPTRRRPTGAARRSASTARPRWAGCSSARRSAGSGAAIFGGVGVHLRVRRDQLVRGGRLDRTPRPRAPARDRPDRGSTPRRAGPGPDHLVARAIACRRTGSSAEPVDRRRRDASLNRLLLAAIIVQRSGPTSRRDVRGRLEPVPRASRRRPRADRPDVRDVRPADPAVLSPYFGRRIDRGGLSGSSSSAGLAPAITGVALHGHPTRAGRCR